MKKLLIANRGEIAIRITQTARDLGLETVAIHSQDDAASLHRRVAHEDRRLEGVGAAAYLDGAQIVRLAKEAGCDAVHPGYGFLSENAAFAKACGDAGIIFVGPTSEMLELFGDKVSARKLAESCGVPILQGTSKATTLAEAKAFFESLGGKPIMVKALAGGGGRGIRPVTSADQLADAFERCSAEAKQAFGNGDLYVEQLFPAARHVEVQIVGDGKGGVVHLYERECSIQRQRQKLIEIAPAPNLHPGLRERILGAALKLAQARKYLNLGTFEFLVDANGKDENAELAFMEANPRLQVEHTVTEEITGLDLVAIQLGIAAGKTLGELGLAQKSIAPPRGLAMQLRINTEKLGQDGSIKPSGGTLRVFEPPSGRGVRVDACGYAGYQTNPHFDPLLAKVIVHSDAADLVALSGKAARALSSFRIAGVDTNVAFLTAILGDADFLGGFLGGRVHTRFVEEHMAALVKATEDVQKEHSSDLGLESFNASHGILPGSTATKPIGVGEGVVQPDGTVAVPSPMQCTVVAPKVAVGDVVVKGQEVVIIEAMKMHHAIIAPTTGVVESIAVAPGDVIYEDHPVMFIRESDVGADAAIAQTSIDLDEIRPDLAEVLERRRLTRDEARPEAVARRRKTGQRTARENIADLVDPGSFLEIAPLVVASQRRRYSLEELIKIAPADGLIGGLCTINGAEFDEQHSRAAVIASDYTVMGGSLGQMAYHKLERMLETIQSMKLPFVMFAEGSGGRGNDTDNAYFRHSCAYTLARLSALVPSIAIVSGRSFGAAALNAGCCDVIIATRDAVMGVGGPAMIEGGGLGVFKTEEIGPMSVMAPNGVVDILVEDEAEAVKTAKKYLSYFQGRTKTWTCADQRKLRHIVPLDRLRAYDMRELIRTLADDDSVLELRRDFGPGIITALIRIEGRPVGVYANNLLHLSGAIDSDGADKIARFLQLCDAHNIPALALVDTPGNMVGPEAEKTGLIRHNSRAFLIGANIDVPLMVVNIRKSYGLGRVAMSGGKRVGAFGIAWPTAEMAVMGLEGQVKLGRKKELETIEDLAEREKAFKGMVQELFERSKALNSATGFGIDDVIDPAETRIWISTALRSQPPPVPREGKRRPQVDGW